MVQVPEKLAQAAHQRLKETLAEQKDTLLKIEEKRPMDAEDDHSRKVSYIQRKMVVSRGTADKIARYGPVAEMPLSEVKKSKAESLQGPTVDFMGICFVDLARAASRSVARVVFRNGNAQGSGFMVSQNLFLTNNHVIPSKEAASGFLLEFNYELDYADKETERTYFELDPEHFFETSRADDLDFTLVAVGKRLKGKATLKEAGYLPLVDSGDKHMKGTLINCIQHPNGTFKNIVVRDSRLLARTPNTLIYSSDTLPGSSGSPVFNDDFEVIALHHWGEPYKALMDPADDPNGMPLNGNEGIRISAIVDHLNVIRNLPQEKVALLNDVLNSDHRQPSLMRAVLKEEKESVDHTDLQVKQPQTDHMAETNKTVATGSTTFTFPLTITVHLGNAAAPAVSEAKTDKEGSDIAAIGTIGGEGLQPDSNWRTRKGYNPNFLGKKIPLPQLSRGQQQAAAENLKAAEGDNPHEFKYHHFSIIMNGERRLAFFTAVNIDGASVVRINRKTGVVTRGPEGAEGREKWFDNNRVDPEEVCEDSLYDDDPDMRIFHRGHLVKRTDPSWGNETMAVKGQADTFFFTNCSPQHSDFNPNKTKWAGLEDWITNTSDDEDLRVTVFSGPVFDRKDRQIGYLQIPEAFWKVVAWMEDGELRATGILASQKSLLDGSWQREGSENFSASELPDKLPEEYKVTIRHLEKIAGLDFGILAQADTYGGQGGGESVVTPTDRPDITPVGTYEELLPGRKAYS